MKDSYGLKSFQKDFPTDAACLDFIFDALHSRECSCGGHYRKLEGRRQFQCSKCRFQIAPTAGTIFEKSVTPLTVWFYAILLFSNAKSGISAKELQRQLEVGYKTAWRIHSQIRKALQQDDTKLKGNVEVDIAYFGGRKRAGENNKNLSKAVASKAAVIVAAERGGRMRAKIIENTNADTIQQFVEDNVETEDTNLITDAAKAYNRFDDTYNRYSVTHSKGEYARNGVHINTVETFFAHLKRSIRGTFKGVSKHHLQTYLDAFVFHYCMRHNDKERFAALLGNVLHV